MAEIETQVGGFRINFDNGISFSAGNTYQHLVTGKGTKMHPERACSATVEVSVWDYEATTSYTHCIPHTCISGFVAGCVRPEALGQIIDWVSRLKQAGDNYTSHGQIIMGRRI